MVRVGEEYLYQSDIDELTFDLNSSDSAELAKSYIDSWIKERLLLQKAVQNLSESQIDFDAQLEDYRKSLIIYAYENQIIKQKLDTLVSPSQLSAYYLQNKANFELKEDVAVARILKCLNSAPNQDSIPRWFKLDEEQRLTKLTQYCAQFTIRCDLDTGNWVPKRVIDALLPSGVDPQEINYNTRKLNVYSDSLERIYIQIIKHKQKGDFAPLPYVADQISDIVRNKRRLDLLSRVKEEIFEEATLKRKYEVFQQD